MPEDANRYEVPEGALIVSPAPDTWHQFFGDEPRTILRAAALPGVHALTAVTVRLGDDHTGLIPDVVVTTADLSRRRRTLDPSELLAVVEIVRPSSGSRDRVLKPDRYARSASTATGGSSWIRSPARTARPSRGTADGTGAGGDYPGRP